MKTQNENPSFAATVHKILNETINLTVPRTFISYFFFIYYFYIYGIFLLRIFFIAPSAPPNPLTAQEKLQQITTRKMRFTVCYYYYLLVT